MLIHLFKMVRAAMGVSRYESPQAALKRLRDAAPAPLKLLLTPDQRGNTVLHHAAMKQKDVATFERNIASVGEEAAIVMAKMANDQGRLPLQIATNVFENPERDTIPLTLYLLTRKHNSKPLHEKIDEKEVLSRYASKPLSKGLHENILIGCAVVNMVRDLKLESMTHPSVNDIDGMEQLDISLSIDRMREDKKDNTQKIKRNMAGAPFDEAQRAHLENEVTVPSEHGVGNCGEFAMLALSFLINNFGKLRSGVFSVEFGDHAMTMFGDKDDEAVVSDPHAGDVYPLSEIPERMTGGAYGFGYLRNKDKIVDWISETSYNPNIHHMKLKFSLRHNSMYGKQR